MTTTKSDVEIIREVRCLCIKQRFEDALYLAQTLEDPQSRRTLILICNSFRQSNFNAREDAA